MSTKPRIKVCGLTRVQDAKLAVELGAWALGFVFFRGSPRAVTPQEVGRILGDLKDPGLKTVGVFVDASLEEIKQAVLASGINTVQLHGEETPEFCDQLKELLPAISVIKALRPKDRSDLRLLGRYAANCESLLLDTYVPGTHGGTGLAGDWVLAEESAKQARVILAGGLNPGNIATALKTAGIYAVDVSSGLEESPGLKSSKKMRAFFENATKKEATA